MFDGFGALLAEHFTVIAYDQRDWQHVQSAGAVRACRDGRRCGRADRGARLRPRACLRHVARRRDRAGAGRAPSRADRPAGAVEHLPRRRAAALDQSGCLPQACRLACRPARHGGGDRDLLLPAAHIAAHPEVVDIFNGTSRTRRAEATPRRHSRASGRLRSRGDHGADAGAGRRRRPADPAGAHALPGARDRTRADRDPAGPRPCRHLAGARRGGARSHRLPENKKRRKRS